MKILSLKKKDRINVVIHSAKLFIPLPVIWNKVLRHFFRQEGKGQSWRNILLRHIFKDDADYIKHCLVFHFKFLLLFGEKVVCAFKKIFLSPYRMKSKGHASLQRGSLRLIPIM